MSTNEFIKSPPVVAWLEQFDVGDQSTAIAMLNAMRRVSAEDFKRDVRARIMEIAAETDGAVALYGERAVPPRRKPPLPLFEQPEERPRRATGKKIPAVDPNDEVGSEGIIAQLITELTREDELKFISHPGPDRLRVGGTNSGPRRTRTATDKALLPVRRFVLVTDLIGSGTRAWRYLEAAWQVATVKSLWSTRTTRGISFEVVAYAATTPGLDVVVEHPTQPKVRVVCMCPTISEAFSSRVASEVIRVCTQYDPLKKTKGSKEALGFQGTGALIAFAHGAPNNTPRILYEVGEDWAPLFPKRVTATTRGTFSDGLSTDDVERRLLEMRQKRLSKGIDYFGAPPGSLERYLVLAALSHPPRSVDVVSRRTGLTQIKVEEVLEEARRFGWVDPTFRLTEKGQLELIAAKAQRAQSAEISTTSPMYYPSHLRAP